jgi:5-methylcytosine-specific restriction endonuclease McrA
MKGKKRSQLWQWQEHAKNHDVECAGCHRLGYCTVDHIVPVFLVNMLGLREEGYDHEWNFQFLCRACNLRKGSNLDYTNSKTLENLKRYITLAEEKYCYGEKEGEKDGRRKS